MQIISTIAQGVFHLASRSDTPRPFVPIDHFLRTVAQDQLGNAVAVILSGTGSDGALGIEAIKAEGGITFAQTDAQHQADRLVLAVYAPPGVILNRDFEVLHFRGDTSPFLTPAPGKASFHVLRMAREGLLVDLRNALTCSCWIYSCPNSMATRCCGSCRRATSSNRFR